MIINVNRLRDVNWVRFKIEISSSCYNDICEFVYLNFNIGRPRKLWKDIGGKCHVFVNSGIAHIGEHAYEGRFADELITKG